MAPPRKLRQKPLITDPRAIRDSWHITQGVFWGLVGVNKPAGCKYENGRIQMPRTVEILVGIVYLGWEPPRPPDYRLEEKKSARAYYPVFKPRNYQYLLPAAAKCAAAKAKRRNKKRV